MAWAAPNLEILKDNASLGNRIGAIKTATTIIPGHSL